MPHSLHHGAHGTLPFPRLSALILSIGSPPPWRTWYASISEASIGQKSHHGGVPSWVAFWSALQRVFSGREGILRASFAFLEGYGMWRGLTGPPFFASTTEESSTAGFSRLLRSRPTWSCPAILPVFPGSIGTREGRLHKQRTTPRPFPLTPGSIFLPFSGILSRETDRVRDGR